MATVAAGGESTGFSTGRVVSRTFAVIGRNIPTFAVLGILVVVPINAYSWFLLHSLPSNSVNPLALYNSKMLPVTIGSFLLQIVLHYWLQAGLVHGTVVDLNGRRATVFECLSTTLRSVVPLIVIAILATLGIYAGIILLIAPGIILATMWFVVVPVRVVEGTGILGTFSRSRALTHGHRGAIFGLLVIYVIGAAVIGLAIRPLSGMELFPRTISAPNPVYWIASVIVGIVLAIVSATGIASVYYELRTIKEGVGPEQLAEVFA